MSVQIQELEKKFEYNQLKFRTQIATYVTIRRRVKSEAYGHHVAPKCPKSDDLNASRALLGNENLLHELASHGRVNKPM
jgi:hypothetical protein